MQNDTMPVQIKSGPKFEHKKKLYNLAGSVIPVTLKGKSGKKSDKREVMMDFTDRTAGSYRWCLMDGGWNLVRLDRIIMPGKKGPKKIH